MKRAFAAALSAGLFYSFYAGTQAGPMAPGDGGYMSAPSALRALVSPSVLLSTQVTPSSGSFVTATPVLFAWTGPSTAAASQLGQYSGFVLQVDETADFLSPLVEITTSPEMYPSSPTVNGEYLSYTAFLHDATYYWRVGIYDGAARSTGAWSQVASFRTDFTAPGMPADFASMQAGTGTITLSWTSQGDDGGLNPLNSALYKVQYSTYGSVAWSTAAAQVTISTNGVLPGASQYYRLENLAANTSYYARLWVFDDAGTQAPATGIANAATFIEFPESVYVDEVGTTTILASAYAPEFTNLDKGYSGVNITTGAQYGVWGSSGSYWTTKRNMNVDHEYGGAAGIGGKVYIVGDGVSDTVLEEYDPVLNNWTTRSPLVPGRRGLAAAALGGKMYVAGGTSSGGSYFLDLAEYDPELNIWTVRAPMPGPRNVPAAAAAGGKLYVFGGYDGGATRQTTYEYDPAADSWSGKQDMPGICSNAAAAPARGYIYVAGCGATKLYRYDPVNNTWSSGADLPTARQALGVAAVGGKVYALGGSNGVSFSAAEVYDPLTGIWTVISSMPAASNGMTAAAAGGRVYALGGSAGMNAVFEYAPGVSRLLAGLQPNTQYTLRALARNQFSATGGESQQVSTYTLAAIAQHPSLPLFGSVSSFSVTVAWSSGTAAGGYNGPGARYVIQASTDTYFRPVAASSDTANIFVALGGLLANTTYYFRAQTFNAGGMTDHSWTVLGATVTAIEAPTGVYFEEIGSSTIAASAYAAAFTHNYLGVSGVNIATGAMYGVWNSTANGWRYRSPMDGGGRYMLAAASLGGKVFAISGSNGGATTAVEVFDPVLNDWAGVPGVNLARKAPAAASLGGRIYLFGGSPTDGTYTDLTEAYDPETGVWSYRAPMPTARYALAAAALGGQIYVAGGYNSGGKTGAVEAYDPSADTWTVRAPLNVPRQGLALGALRGRLYAAAGFNDLSAVGDNEEYDPHTNTWSPKATLQAARSNPGSAVFAGRLLIVGGSNGGEQSACDVYDPLNNSWDFCPPLSLSRWYLAAAAVNGKVYAVGGQRLGGNMADTEEFDPSLTRVFSGLKPNTEYSFRAKARNQAGAETAESSVVSTYTLAAVAPSTGPAFTELAPNSLKVWWSSGTAAGGYNGPGASYRIEYATSANFGGAYWTQPSPDSINALLSGLTANTTYHFRVRAYNAGGMTDYSWVSLGSTVTAVEQPVSVYMDEVGTTTIVASAYAPGPAFTGLDRGLSGVNISLDGAYGVWGSSGNYWTTRAYMTTPRWGHGVASGGRKVYAVGGSGTPAYMDSVEVYDPALNTWSTIASPMTTARRGAAAAVIGRKLYVAGGNNGADLNVNEAYDLETGVWSPRAPMPTARHNAAAGAIGGKLYVVGGQGAVLLNVNEAYDPALDSWSGKTGMNVAREGAGSGVIGSMLYVAGGNSGGAIAVNEEYDAIADTWTTRAPMNFARYRMAGAAAGGKFYAFGGFSVSPLKTAEAYDPAGNTWTRLPDMAFARADLLAAGSAGGRLYVTGGYGAGTMGDNEEYTPGTARVFSGLQPNTPHSFAAKARNQAGDISPESAAVSTYTMAAVALFPGGTFSGVTSAGATIYWSSGTGGITGFNGPGASYKLQASTAADFTGNKITSSTIATSAFLDLAANTSYYFRVQAFNAGGMTDYSWLFLGSTVTTVNQPLPAPAAAVSTFSITAAWNPNGNSPDTVYTAQISSFATFTPVLISSLVTSTSVVFGPLPAANTFYFMRVNAVNRSGSATNWTVLDSTAALIEAPASVYIDEVSAATITVSAYVPGGLFSGLQLGLSAVAITSGTYDLWGSSGNYWQSRAPMTGGSRSSPGAAALGGKIYVIGGNAAGAALNRNEAYDPAANSWATLANMPTSRDYLALVPVGGRLYAIGGRNGATHYKKTEAYDPEGGAWKTLSDMASARRSFAAAAIGSKIYVAGGYSGAADLASTEVFDVDAGTWSPRAPLDTPRHNLAGAAVNGKFYAIGGYNGSVFNNVEEYDPGLNDWSPKAGLPTPRGALGAVALGGKIYAAGGTVDANNGLSALEVFDPAMNYWSQAAPSAQKRHTLAAAVMGGRLYLAGGYDNVDLASVEAFTPGSARVFAGLRPNKQYSFRAKARNALGVETGESAVVSTWTLAAVALPASGDAFVSVTESGVTVAWSSGTAGGGYNSQDASYKVQASTAADFSGTIYSDAPTTNLAQSISLSPNTTYYFRVQAYNSGGMTDHSWLLLGSTVTRIEAPTTVYFDEVGVATITASAYAPAPGFSGLDRQGSGLAVTNGTLFGVWGSTGGYWENKKPVTSARASLAAAALGGKLYALGGNGGNSALNEVYDPVSDSWQTKAPMLTARQSLAAAALGGKLYALGGFSGSALGANEEYDPVADTWTARAPLPTPRYGLGAAALNGKIYAVGGFGTSSSEKNEEYDPVADTWTARAPLTPARYGLGAAALNGRIYAVGGYAGGYSGRTDAYDPAANTWAPMDELTPRSSLAVAVAGGKIFALGGTTGADSALAEEYDPVSNAWTQRQNLTAPRTNLAAAFLGGRIYAVGGGSGLPQDSNEAYVTGASRVFTGLLPNTKYNFKAAARGQDGTRTAASPTVSTYTLAAVALPAGGNPFQSVQASAVSLQWSSGTAAVGYNGPGASYFLHYSTSPDFKPALGLQTSPDIITANVAGLSANTTYHFRIRAVNAGGMTDYSWLNLGSTMTAVETPATVIFDTVDVTTIVVSGYAPGAAFTNIDQGLSGLRIAKDGAWSVWGSTGNYWSLRAELTPYRWNTAGAVLNGRVHVAGGWNGSGDESSFSNYHDAYDPALNTWTSMPLLPTRRSVYAAGVMSGKFYVVGGHNASNLSGLATNEAYDPEAGQWVTLEPMPTARTTMGAAVHGGKLYVIGGSVNVTETYDPETDSWTTGLQPMPTSRNNVGVVSVGNKIYAVGGDSLASNEEYDPAANTWTAKAPMLFGRYHHGVGAVGGKLYALGGISGSEITNVEMYDPSADTWTVRAPLPDGRRLMAVVPAKGNLYLLGGFPTPAAGPVLEYITGAARPFTGLTPNTQYSFKAQARGAAGTQTAESVEVSTYTLAARPIAMQLFAVTTGQVLASWSSNSNPLSTDYVAQISTSPDFLPVERSSNTKNTYAALSNIGSNTTYYLRVQALNGLNVPTAWTALGSTVTMVNPPVFLPVAAVSTFTVTAAWDANGNSAGTIYNAEVSANSGFTAVAASTVTELTSVELGPLAVANTYYYLRVNAVNRSGSQTAWTPLGSTVAAIEAVSSMTFVAVSSKAVTAQAVSDGGYTWLSEELSGIDIAFEGAYGGWTKLDSSEYTGLQPNKSYSFKARSRNRLGAVTPESAEFSTWTLAAVAAPAGSSAYQAVWLSSAVVAYSSGTAAWGFNASAASYLVEADNGGNFDGAPVSSRTVALAAALDLSPNATWYFRARAYNALNVPGEWALFGSTATQIETPTGIEFTAVGPNDISLQVQGTPGFSNLSSGLSSIAKAKNGVYDPWFNSTADTYSGLTPNTQYAFSAKARNLEGRVTPEITVSTWTLAVQPAAAAGFYDAYANSLWFGWSDGGNPAGTLYRAEVSTASDYSVIAASSETLNVYASLTALQANTTYYGRVAAVNGAGVYSAYLAISATSTRIETPASVQAEEVWVSSVAVRALDSFSGLDAGLSGLSFAKDGAYGPWLQVSTASFTGLLPNTLYAFKARARNQAGILTAQSPSLSTVTLAAVTPAQDGATWLSVHQSSVAVAWSSGTVPGGFNGSGAKYKLQASTSADFTGSQVSLFPVTQVSTSVTGLQSNTTYFFRVQAYNFNNVTDGSWLVLGTTVTMAIPPAASGTPFVQVWHDGIEPAWSANGNSEGTAYRLQVSSHAGFGEVYSTSYPLYATTAAIGGLTPNTTWYARAAAVSYAGVQTEYYVIGGTLTPMAAPTDVLFPAVSSLTITAEAWSSYGFPNLAEGQSGLAYWRAGQGWTPWTSASSSVVSGLAPNTRYDIKARARGQSGLETAESPLVSTYTLATVSLPQQGPLYEDLDTNMLTVHWSSGTAAEGFNGPGVTYRIVSAASGDFSVSPQSSDVTDLFRPFVGLSANTTYYHKVRAYNQAGVASDWLVLGATATLTGKPGSVAIAAVHPTSASLTWAAMGAASSGYLVQASTLAGFTGLVRSSSTPNGFLGGLTVTGLLANTSYFLRVGSLNHGGTPNFEAALSTLTPAENEPPTITDMELGTDYSWYSALPARTYNINFFDTGGSALENFQVRATTGPLQTGVVNAEWTDIATGLDVDSYTADWPLTQGAWDLLADGTNYISVQVFDGSGNKDVREDAFIVFKDSTPPAISHGFDGAVWRSTFGFTVPLQFADAHSRVDGAQGTVWTSTGLTGVQLWPWTSLFAGADAHQHDENLVMAEAGWNLLASGTNYFSLQAGDYSLPANTTTWTDAFVILKDTVPPPAVADAAAVSGSTWSATFGFGVPADFPSGAADYAMQYSTFAVALATYSVPGSTLSLVNFPGAAAGTPLSFLRWPLSPNTTYYFGVRSADRAGNWSAASNAAEAVTLAEAPVSAAPLVYYSSAAFSWGAVASAGYAAHASTAPDFTGAQLSSVTADGGAAGIYVTGLTPNTTYYLRAASLNWAGERNYAPYYEDTTLAVVPGSAAVYAAVSSVAVTVEWLSGGNSAGTAYRVGVSSDGHATEMYAVPFSSAGPGPYRRDFTGLQPNTTYWFRVLAQGHGGDFTDWLTLGSTMTLPVPPNLTSYEAWESSAAVAWDANGNGAGTLYQLDLSTDALFAPVEVTTVTADLSFAAGLQLPDTTYYLRLRSLSSGSGQASAYAAGEQVSRAAAPQTVGFYSFGANSLGVYWGGARNQGGRRSGEWAQSGSLPSGLYGHAAVLAGDLLVVTGGNDGSGYKPSAWAARLGHDGSLGDWSRTRDLPGARYGHASFFAKGRVYAIGGYDGSSVRAEVWSAPLSSSGALGEWREEAPLPQAVYAHASFGLGDRIYVLGGYNGGARDEAYFADPADDGAIASWTPAGTLPAARYALAAAVALSSAAPRLCVTGGSDGALARSEAWTAAINGDGTLGGWAAATPLPNGLFAHAMAPYNGALFVLGGNNGSGARTAVLRAAVRYDGSIGPWEAQPSLPQALQSHAAGDRYGRLLALGGYDGAVSRSALYQAYAKGAEYTVEVAGAQFSSTPWSSAGFAQVGSLAPNTLYGFRVKARNSAGAETPYSAQFTTRTYASQPSTAAFGGVYMSSVQVNWIGHDNPAGTVYDVQLSSDAAHTLLASSVAVATVGHLFTGLDQDHLYYARVRAVNDGGTATAWTVLGSTTTRTDPSLDLSSPVITVNQAGDAAWRNAGGALYDVDMTDAGGAYLQRFEVRASTSPAGQPPFLTAWTTVAGGLQTAGYSDDWALPDGFFGLLAPGTNYISVQAWDHNGNSTAAVDAFYVLKDTEAPVITDGQTGEDFWRMDDAGAAYDVDFADGLSGLAAIEYSASPNQGSGDAAGYGWRQVAAVAAGTAAYTADWGVNFAQLPNDATNFISVRATDRAGNTASVTGIDVFKVLKYVAGPEVWMTSPSAAYHSALAVISGTSSDARSHASSGVEVSLWSAQDGKYWNGSGFLGSSPVWFAAAGTATWSWNPGVAWQEGYQYETVARASDTAGNYSLAYATRAFYFDTQEPVISYSFPASGSAVNSVNSFSGVATDLSGISKLGIMLSRASDGKWWDFDAGTWAVSGTSAAVAAAANWVYTPPELLKASLESGASYYYTVYAEDNSVPAKNIGFGGYTAVFGFTDDTAPGAITDLYASTGNAPGNISLSWSAAGDDGGSGMILYGQYRVEYSTSAANAFSTAAAQVASDFTAVSAGSARTRELTGLAAGETYYLRAWTRDDAGNWSALSNGATAQAAPFPDRISGRVMTVSSAGITGVLVEAFDTDGALKASAYTLNDGSGSYVLAPLAAGSYRVQATWEAEEIVSSVGTEGFALGRSDADFRLSIGYELAAIGGELAGYRLTVSGRRALAAGTARVQLFQRGRMVAEAPVDAAGRFRLRGLLPGKYTLRVPAPEGGYKEMSVRVKAGEALVINPLADLLKAAKVYVYPNPARNTVKFHLECGQPGARMQVTVFDLAGRAIKEFRETDFTGNAGGNPDAYEATWRIPAKVASGVYIYTVRVKFDATGEYKKVTKKFAIVR